MLSPLTPPSPARSKLFGEKPALDELDYELGFARSARQRAAVVAWRRSIVRTFPRRTTARRGVRSPLASTLGKVALPRTAVALALLSVLALIAWGGAEAIGHEAGGPLYTSGIPATGSEDHLGANAGPATRMAAALPERDALTQIRALAARSTLEEQWAYLPDHDLWIEIGINEKSNETGAEVEADSALLKALMTGFDKIDLYHFHPNAFFEGRGESFSSETPAADLSTKELASVSLALPSPADVQTSLEMTLLARSLGSSVELRHFVVSPIGTVSYGPTRRGNRKLVADRGNPRSSLGHEIMVTAAVRRGPVNIAKTVERETKLSVSELLSTLCAQMSADLYAASFQPLEHAARDQSVAPTPPAAGG